MCIELKDIGLTFSNRVIFKEVNARFSIGFNLIYGSSGSGKTSLLKIINMLISPTKGSVLYKGKNIESYDSSLWRGICILTKQTAFFSSGNVIENIRLPFEFKVNKEKEFDEELLGDLLDEFNLGQEILAKDVDKLSGGEAQRVSIIRSILLKPNIFLFDEPTSALDGDTQEKMFGYIKRLSNRKICIVASHAKEAFAYADSVFSVENKELKSV